METASVKLAIGTIEAKLTLFTPRKVGGEKGTKRCTLQKVDTQHLSHKTTNTSELNFDLYELERSGKNRTDHEKVPGREAYAEGEPRRPIRKDTTDQI